MTDQPLLDVSGIARSYGPVRALRNASLSVRPGEVHALMGANGAGKSTLVKILTGAVRPDVGRIVLRGQALDLRSPAAARQAGLVPVYQEPALIPDLTIADNLRLTGTPVAAFRDWLGQLGIDRLDLGETARRVPLAVLRVVDLARALAAEPAVLLLDEMTAALPADLAERVLDVVRRQGAGARAVVFISHRMLEIRSLCDRATVLRDGETVGVVPIGPGAEEEIVELMLGEPAASAPAGERGGERAAASRAEDVETRALSPGQVPRLEIRNIGVGARLSDVSFDLKAGEVLGLVALEGQGQDELFDVLSGERRPSRGTLRVEGREVRFGHPADAIAEGLVLVPGDRADGLLPQRSVGENVALPFHARPAGWGLAGGRDERERVLEAIRRLQIDMRAGREVRRLSGGNQQKVTIARWIATGAPTILCFDPTRGIDIRTKREIYRLVRELAASGASVLLYTSELEEVRLACDRVVVIFGGRVVDTFPAVQASEAVLVRAAYGLPRAGASHAGGPEAAPGILAGVPA